VISYEQVVEAGVRLLLRTSTVDLDQLARELAVSRATLYRVTPGRERLVADVLWELTDLGFRDTVRRAPGQGVDRLVDIAAGQLSQIAGTRSFVRFLQGEPDLAFRALFMPQNELHVRMVGRWADLLAAAERAGDLRLPHGAEPTANVVVTVGTSVLYTGLLAGQPPDLGLARHALRSLLTSADRPVVVDLEPLRPRLPSAPSVDVGV
jgi:AcrR family transcriptional regulator